MEEGENQFSALSRPAAMSSTNSGAGNCKASEGEIPPLAPWQHIPKVWKKRELVRAGAELARPQASSRRDTEVVVHDQATGIDLLGSRWNVS